MEPDVGEETAGLLAKDRARQRGTSSGDARAGGEGEQGREGAPLQLGYASSLRPHGYIYNPNCILPSAAVAVLLLYKSGFVYCDF